MEIKRTGHSRIGASSYKRWKNCPGSVNLSVGIPQSSSSYADEGTKAHEAASYYLEKQMWPEWAETEMIEAVEVYTNAVLADKAQCDWTKHGNLFLVEHGFDLSQIHRDAWGTSDCVIYNVKQKLLIVYDYKHGAGISVDVNDNEQLIYYALGALLSTGVPCEDIHIKIVQPRCPHPDGAVRVHKFKSVDIIDFAADLERDAKATDDPKAPLNPGDWCRFCPAAAVCPALGKKAMVLAKTIFKPSVAYDPQVLADTLEKLPMVEGFISQVREFAYAEAMKGRVPPGYKLVEKRATRKWKEVEGIGKFLSKVLDTKALKTCFTEPVLRSPAQIEKIVGKAHAEKLDTFIIAESSGYKLAHNSDPGTPIMLDAKSIFDEQSMFE